MKRTVRVSFKKLNIPQIPVPVMTELPFFASYILYLAYMILSVSFYLQYINEIWKPVYVLCIGLLCIYELVKNGLNLKNILTVCIMVLLFVNITRIGQGIAQNAIASVMFYMFCARDIPFRKICRVTVFVSGVMLAFVVLSAEAGIITNYVAIAKAGERRREFLGFLYALNASTLMSNITLLWVWLKKEKLSLTSAAILTAINFWLFRKTDSRMCFALTVLMLVFALFLRKHERFVLRRKMICRIAAASFILACIVSFGLTVKYNPSVGWMNKINTVFGNRLSLGQESLKQIGIAPLGITGIKWVGAGLNMYGEVSNDTYLYVDSYYIQIAQRFGWVFLGIVLVILTIAAYRAYKRKDIWLLAIFAVIAAHFMIDNLRMYLHYNTFWLAAGGLAFFGKGYKIIHNSEFIIQN